MVNEDRIDLSDLIAETCERCETKVNMTYEIRWTPGEIVFGCFVPNEHGSPYIDKKTGEAVTEQITKRIIS